MGKTPGPPHTSACSLPCVAHDQDTDRISEICSALINAAADGMTAAGWTPPDRRFNCTGTPVFDGPILAASMARMFMSDGTPEGQMVGWQKHGQLGLEVGEFNLWVVNQALTFDETLGEYVIPDDDDYTEDAREHHGSMRSIVKGVRDARRAGKFETGTVAFREARVIEPQGGLVGFVMTYLVALTADPI